MGGICCCARLDENEEYYPSNTIYGQCLCLHHFFHQLFTGYTAMFQRPQGRSLMTPVPGSSSLASSGIGGALPDNSAHDIHIANRTPPYGAEQRYSRLQRDGLVSRREKSMTHFQEESLPLRRNASSSALEALGYDKKRNSVESEAEGKVVLSDSEKLSLRKALGLYQLQSSSEDEDVCPTCLEEYTPENPKIMTKCSHHFHLGCIYEWMERSESCPICCKIKKMGIVNKGMISHPCTKTGKDEHRGSSGEDTVNFKDPDSPPQMPCPAV